MLRLRKAFAQHDRKLSKLSFATAPLLGGMLRLLCGSLMKNPLFAFPLFAFVAGSLLVAGCASHRPSKEVEQQFIPQPDSPMSQAAWRRFTGVYSGPVRMTNYKRFDARPTAIGKLHVEIGGSAQDPQVVIKGKLAFSNAITPYDESRESFSNIPTRKIEGRSSLEAWTHAPRQLVLALVSRKNSPWDHCTLIVTFRGPFADVRAIGENHWIGEGRLDRLPEYEVDPR